MEIFGFQDGIMVSIVGFEPATQVSNSVGESIVFFFYNFSYKIAFFLHLNL